MSDVKKFYENESRNSDNNTDNNGTQNMNVYESAMSEFEGMMYEETAEEKSKTMKLALASVTDDEIEALTGADLEIIRANKEKRMQEDAKAELEKKKQLDEKKKKQKETVEKIAGAGADITIGFAERLLGLCIFFAATTKIGYNMILRKYNIYDFNHVMTGWMQDRIRAVPGIINQNNCNKAAIKQQKKYRRQEHKAYMSRLGVKGRIMYYVKNSIIIAAMLLVLLILLVVSPLYDFLANIFLTVINNPILRIIMILFVAYIIAVFIGLTIAPAIVTAKRSEKPRESYDDRVKKAEESLKKGYEDKMDEIEKINVKVKLEDLTRDDKAEYILQKRNGVEY